MRSVFLLSSQDDNGLPIVHTLIQTNLGGNSRGKLSERDPPCWGYNDAIKPLFVYHACNQSVHFFPRASCRLLGHLKSAIACTRHVPVFDANTKCFSGGWLQAVR